MKKILYILFIFISYYIMFNNNLNYISNEKFINDINNNTEFYKINDVICYYDNTKSNFFVSNYNCSPNIRLNLTTINTFTNNVTKYTEGNYNILNSLLYLLLPLFVLITIIKRTLSSKLVNNFSDIIVKNDIDKNITIDNFIGCNNIKKDINEVILQIKNNNLFLENNCNLPKGILLLGPPGCGKTHLVKTIINSTGINYIFTSGSDINKIFVGSGSMMIDNLFTNARNNKPCIIFIDEADTIIKARQHVEVSSTTTEFGSTLCKLLAELDSLKTESDIIVIFATNMNEQFIDKALLRSGRVDKIIYINEPIYEERIQLFKMYLDKLINDNIDLNKIAKISYGLTGADVKKIINSIKIKKINKYLNDNVNKVDETNIINKISEVKDKDFKLKIKDLYKKIIYKNNKKDVIENNDITNNKLLIEITTKDISEEIDRCILGLEREKKINNENRKLIAYHETGHAIMSFLLKDTILPTKVCISITSKTLGYTMYHNDEEDIILNSSLNNLLRQIMILYSGRCAEKKFMNEVTCGAEDDYSKARKLLKRILMNGMLLNELNYVETDYRNEIKVPDFIEKIMNIINKLLIDKINNLFEKNKLLINKIAKIIIINGSITDDEIKQIFIDNNMVNRISSIDINHVRNEIIKNIEKIEKKIEKIKSK
jgi:cell division protease FtsH